MDPPDFLPPLMAKPSEMPDLTQKHLLGQFFDFSLVTPTALLCPGAHQPQDPVLLLLSTTSNLCLSSHCWQRSHFSTQLMT